ncbi:hypothetical protein [Mycobacterium persicum]|uniref:hypothetical protein n=1 Tax=Mycobacterium persicum TaxID=1487726 RepID=UPI002159A7D2|nr:hypothetical protein [Mycobacterium persicum]
MASVQISFAVSISVQRHADGCWPEPEEEPSFMYRNHPHRKVTLRRSRVNHILGQVNPDLVRDTAYGLGPYVKNIAGTSEDCWDLADRSTTSPKACVAHPRCGVGRIAGPTIGILGHNLENAVLGPTPTAPAENPIQPMSLGMADQEILNAMLGTGHTVAGLPPGYIVYDHDHPNGRIATPEELGVTAGQYNSVIGPALSQSLEPRPPSERFSPDVKLVSRYDDIVGVPHPHQGRK